MTMDVREKLVELLKSVLPNFQNNMAYWGEKPIYEFADCLLANGVTVQECKLGVKKTNADRIRSMSDEGLAVFFDEFSSRCLYCAEDAKNQSCPIYKEGHYCRPQEIMEWLQQPAEGE